MTSRWSWSGSKQLGIDMKDLELPPHDHLDERQFVLAIKRLADSLSYGNDASPYLGSGIDFAQSRVYEPGDPVKSIDWRVTARTGRVYVKEYEAPKRMPIYLLLDTSASMCVASGPSSKYAVAVQLVGGLGLAALARMSPVAVIGCGERDFDLRASLSRERLFLRLHQLRRYQLDETTRVGLRVGQLGGLLEHRCLLLVLTDLHDPDAVSALKEAGQRHDCVVLQLSDPAERGKTGGGFFRGEEAETERPHLMRGARRQSVDEQAAWGLAEAGLDHLHLPIDQPFLPRLTGFLRQRSQLGKGAR
jgi:uncharacterized protein (DUF58 family)